MFFNDCFVCLFILWHQVVIITHNYTNYNVIAPCLKPQRWYHSPYPWKYSSSKRPVQKWWTNLRDRIKGLKLGHFGKLNLMSHSRRETFFLPCLLQIVYCGHSSRWAAVEEGEKKCLVFCNLSAYSYRVPQKTRLDVSSTAAPPR